MKQYHRKQNDLLKKNKTCITCGNLFSGRKGSAFCSKSCVPKKPAQHKQKVTRECVGCRKSFLTWEKVPVKYCSLGCKKKYDPDYKKQKCESEKRRRESLKTDPTRLKRHRDTRKKYKKLQRKVRKHHVHNATPCWIKPAMFAQLQNNCPENHDLDHIIPLRNPSVCGLNVPWNIQYLSKEENNKKSNKFDGTYDNNGWK